MRTPPADYIERKDLAAMLGASEHTVRDWQKKGLIPHSIVCGKPTRSYYPPEAVSIAQGIRRYGRHLRCPHCGRLVFGDSE